MSNLYHLKYEKYFLSAALKNPSLIDEYANIISKDDFSKTHQTIYQAIKIVKKEKGDCNKLLVIDYLKACNQRIGEEVEPDIYIEGLDQLSISEESVHSIVLELTNKTVQRKLNNLGQQIVAKTNHTETKNGLELLNEVNSIFNREVNILDSVRKNEPRDLFSGAEEHIETIGNNPRIDGVEAPYPMFRELFGDFSVGDMSFIIARAKAGKSTWLLSTLIKCVEQSKKNNRRFKTLVLDTELDYEREVRRMVSSLSGVGEYWLRTGFWRKNEEMVQKVRAVWALIKPWYNTIDHIYVGNMKLPEILSVIRRWHGKNVGVNDDTDTIVCLDYVKLGSQDDLGGGIKDYQLVGQKVDAHKQLAVELRYHCLTAGQANRLNEGRDESEIISDGRAVGLSDQISQFASNIYLLQRLTNAQYAQFKELATHMLLPLYTRNQGPQSQGFSSFVKYKGSDGKDKYSDNFLLFNIESFNVKELTDFRTWVKNNSIGKADLHHHTDNSNTVPI